MGEFILGGVFIVVASALGVGLGCWMRGRGNRWAKAKRFSESATEPTPARPVVPQPVLTQPVVAPPEPALTAVNVEAIEEVMAQVKQLTESVAADVGVHNSQIQEIGQELVTTGGSETSVLAIVEKLVNVNEVMQNQLQSADEQLQEQALELESHAREARTDALTKLYNRRAFDDEINKAGEEAHSNGRALSVLMMDVDHFKKFNDTYGHQAGDEVLRGVAHVLSDNLSDEEIVCRYGGEEFVVIFPGTDIEAALPAAERARLAIGKEVFEYDGMDLRVTASAGLAQLQTGETVQALVKRADDALYVCKESGRNNGHWHDGEDSHPMTESTLPETTPPSDEEVELELDIEPTLDSRDRIKDVSDRDAFSKDIDRRITEYKRSGTATSLVVVDIDRFAEIVEEYGEKASEIVLRATAQFMKATMGETDHVARLEKSEFGLLLPGADLDAANEVAERLRSAVQRCALPINGETLKYSVSVGTTEIAMNDGTQDPLSRAQSSVKAAIGKGGNCTVAADKQGDLQALTLSS